MKKTKILGLFLVALGVLALVHPDAAFAAGAGGGTLPWDTGITTFRQDITGPWAYSVSLLLLAISGVSLYRADGEMSGFVRGMIGVVMVCALLVLAQNAAEALGIAGAVVA